MRWIPVMAPLLAFFSLGGCGDAPGAPWCAHYSTGNNECSFYSFQQCTAAISGSAEYALRTNVLGAAGKVDCIPPPERGLKGGGRQHLLRFEANAVGWGSALGVAFAEIIAAASLTPTRLALLADLPLSGGGTDLNAR